jgi:hypothetical protein
MQVGQASACLALISAASAEMQNVKSRQAEACPTKAGQRLRLHAARANL